MKMLVPAAAAALLAFAGSANAGTLLGVPTVNNVFGSSYSVAIYRVAGDLSGQTLSPAAGRLEPEGMVWYNGALYVTGDGTTAEANGYMAAYAGGALGSAPAATRLTATLGATTAAYGPEGITINTRGIGVGAASNTFVGIDSVIAPVSTRILATMPITGGTVGNVQTGATLNYDDIAFVPGAAADGSLDRFAVIESTSNGVRLTYLAAATGLPTGANQFNLDAQDKGLLFLPAVEADLLRPGTGQDVLLVAQSAQFAGDDNRLFMYTLAGSLLETAVLPASLFSNAEALAYDPIGKRLFIGDENSGSSNITVFTVPAPGALSLLVGAGLLASRRRR